MIRIGHVKDFDTYKDEIGEIFGETIKADCYEQLEVLDHYYGEDRDMFKDDGGYLIFLKDENEWKSFNKNTARMLERNYYETFFNFMNDSKSEKYVRVDYMLNEETVISIYMLKELFKE